MTLKPLDFDFPLMSGLSRRPPHAVDQDELLLEVDEELAHRRKFYGRMVERGKLKREDAARHIAVLLAIRSDLAGRWDRSYSWEEKVRELRRELAMRRNMWPRAVASATHPLNSVEAARRMERMEALHFAYWMRLDFYESSAPIGTPAAHEEMRALGAQREAWERAEHEAGNPAARAYLAPADWAALTKGRKAA